MTLRGIDGIAEDNRDCSFFPLYILGNMGLKPLKEDHSEWLDQTMSTLNDMKQSKPSPTSKSWNRRIVISHRRKLYDSTQDKYCPRRTSK